MGNFRNWLFKETNIGNFPEKAIEEDPANVHPIAFDHAWEEGDKEKDQWFDSVNKTANKFMHILFELRTAVANIHQSLYDRYFTKAEPTVGEVNGIQDFISRLTHIIWIILGVTRSVSQAHADHDIIHFANALKKENFNLFEEDFEKISNEKVINHINQYFAPEHAQAINTILGWVHAIHQKLKESKSDIRGHQLRNHTANHIPEIAGKVATSIKQLTTLYHDSTFPPPIKRELLERLWKFDVSIDLIKQLAKGDISGLKEPTTRSLIESFQKEAHLTDYIYLTSQINLHHILDETIPEKYHEFVVNLGDLLLAVETGHNDIQTEANAFGIPLGRDSTSYQAATDYALENGDEEFHKLMQVFNAKANQYIQYLNYIESVKVPVDSAETGLGFNHRIPRVMRRIQGTETPAEEDSGVMRRLVRSLRQNLLMINHATLLNKDGKFPGSDNFAAIQDLRTGKFDADHFNGMIDQVNIPDPTKYALKRITHWLSNTHNTLKNNYGRMLNLGTGKTNDQLGDFSKQYKSAGQNSVRLVSLADRLESILDRLNHEAPDRDDYEGPYSDLLYDLRRFMKNYVKLCQSVEQVYRYVVNNPKAPKQWARMDLIHGRGSENAYTSVQVLMKNFQNDNHHPFKIAGEMTDHPIVSELGKLCEKYFNKGISSMEAFMDSVQATKQARFADFDRGIRYNAHGVENPNE